MSQGVGVVGLYVRDQDEALAFYVEKLGFRVHTDARNGDYRWLTVQHPDQPSFQLGLFTPGPPTLDAATAQTLREIVAKGAMPPLVLVVDDCRAAYDRMRARGVEFTQEPVDRYGSVDAGFRDPSGNGWKMIEARARLHQSGHGLVLSAVEGGGALNAANPTRSQREGLGFRITGAGRPLRRTSVVAARPFPAGVGRWPGLDCAACVPWSCS